MLLRRVSPVLLQSTLPCVSSRSHLSSSLARSRSTVSLQTLIKSLSSELVFSAILEMKLARFALRSYDGSTKFGQLCKARAISTNTPSGDVTNGRNESPDEFEQRIFGGYSSNNPTADAFYQKLDRLEKARGRPAFNSNMDGNNTGGSNSSFLDGLDDSFSTLSDGMDGKLKNAANYFEFDPDEINSEDYAFRPDVTFSRGTTYEPKDLDLTKPGVRKPPKRYVFEVTTEEVLRKADFRNVRFLANFITEAGIIIKRSQTRISAKAQRKVAREIKTARAFGLMPFTTMGQDPFAYGKSREIKEEEKEGEEDDVEDNYDDPISPEDII